METRSSKVFFQIRVFAIEVKKKKTCDRGEEKKKITWAEKSEFPSLPDFGVFASEVNQILQATPPKIRREGGR